MTGHKPGQQEQNELLWIGGYCALPLLTILLSVLLMTGCSGVQRSGPLQVWDDMKHQQKFGPQAQGPTYKDSKDEVRQVFSDYRAARRPPFGTIAHGHMQEDTPYFTGREAGQYIKSIPVPVTMELMKTGQAKFNIYCSPCHDKQGTGQGIVPLHAPSWQPSNLTEQRLLDAVDGDLYNVITEGRRFMPSYRYQIDVADRWAIVAYVRALQRASHGTANDVPADQRAELR